MAKPEKIIRVQLDLSEVVLKALEELAVKDRRSRKNYMEKLLTDYVEESKRKS